MLFGNAYKRRWFPKTFQLKVTYNTLLADGNISVIKIL